MTNDRRPILLGIAGAAFLVGLVSIAIIFALAASGAGASPILHIGALAAPLGLVLAVVYALRSGRRARQNTKG